jgi:hypothetical protein
MLHAYATPPSLRLKCNRLLRRRRRRNLHLGLIKTTQIHIPQTPFRPPKTTPNPRPPHNPLSDFFTRHRIPTHTHLCLLQPLEHPRTLTPADLFRGLGFECFAGDWKGCWTWAVWAGDSAEGVGGEDSFTGFLGRGGFFGGFDGGGEVDWTTNHIEHARESGAVTRAVLDEREGWWGGTRGGGFLA